MSVEFFEGSLEHSAWYLQEVVVTVDVSDAEDVFTWTYDIGCLRFW